MKRSVWLKPQLFMMLTLVAAVTVVGIEHQAIQDWVRLRGYAPPDAIAKLAQEDTMTASARHLFYVNHPGISTGSNFKSHCPVGSEKTIVLGCYTGDDDGIYIYAVSDARLEGVEQVTAAHETLHAAYARLSSHDRAGVDAMLLNYYHHGLTDQRIKDTIAAYKQSEPNDVVNEMHSVFGTEVANLPGPLENYYKQYFSNRAAITGYAARYEGEFTGRQLQLTAYDKQLASLKAEIETNEAQLSQQKTSLDSQSQQLQGERSSGQVSAYNAGVERYNSAVDTYNSLLDSTKNLISQYNTIVSERNSIALEEQQLVNALSSDSLPSAN